MNRKACTMMEVLLVLAIIALFVALLISASFPTVHRQAQGNANASYGEVWLESNEDNAYYYLPRTATNIIEHGNYWYEFTLNGNRWLYHSYRYDQGSLVLIPGEQRSD